MNATKSRIQQKQFKWHCAQDDHSKIGHNIALTINDLMTSPDQFHSLPNRKMIYLANHFLEVEYDGKNPTVILDCPKTGINRNLCDERRWLPVIHTFLTCKERLWRSECPLGELNPTQLKFCKVHWKIFAMRQPHKNLCLHVGLFLMTVFFSSFSNRRRQHGETRNGVLYHQCTKLKN